MLSPGALRSSLGVAVAALLVAGILAAQGVSGRHAPAGFEGELRLSGFAPTDVVAQQGGGAAALATPPTTAAPPAARPAAPASPAPPTTARPARPAPARTAPPPTQPAGGNLGSVAAEPACAQLPAGMTRRDLRGGPWFARRSTGRTATYSVYVEAFPCDVYDGEGTRISGRVDGPQGTFDLTLDYGDGTSPVQSTTQFPCMMATPVPVGSLAPPHAYAQAGTYTATAQLGLQACTPPGGPPPPVETITLTVPVQRIAGPRPHPVPEFSLTYGPPAPTP